jgi:hypothetical protein
MEFFPLRITWSKVAVMFQNYLKTALRSLKKNKGFTIMAAVLCLPGQYTMVDGGNIRLGGP